MDKLNGNCKYQMFFLSYPVLTHIAISQHEFELALLILGTIAGLSILSRSRLEGNRSNYIFDFILWAGLFVFAVFIFFTDLTRVALYFPPIFILSFFVINFGKSLLPGQEALLTKIARIVFHDDSPESIIYTRQVTWVWTCFLTLLLIQTVALSLLASLEVWSLFTNILNYVFIGILFIAEYIYRQVRFGYRYNIFYYLRGLSQASLKQFF